MGRTKGFKSVMRITTAGWETVWEDRDEAPAFVEKVSYSTKNSHQNMTNSTKKTIFLVELDMFW